MVREAFLKNFIANRLLECNGNQAWRLSASDKCTEPHNFFSTVSRGLEGLEACAIAHQVWAGVVYYRTGFVVVCVCKSVWILTLFQRIKLLLCQRAPRPRFRCEPTPCPGISLPHISRKRTPQQEARITTYSTNAIMVRTSLCYPESCSRPCPYHR